MLYSKLKRKALLSGLKENTITNYSRCIAQVALHFKCTPINVKDEDLESYLYDLRKKYSASSSFYFNHCLFALRYLFKLYGQEERIKHLPKIKPSKQLPTVLNREEVIRLLRIPSELKSRVLLGLCYDTGMRLFELQKLHISDIDIERKLCQVRSGKYGKGRYIPISNDIIRGINHYIDLRSPITYLFNGRNSGQPMSKRTIQRVMTKAVQKAGIIKPVTLHSLRHSYATHFLEDTGDLFSLKKNMGHAAIQSTLLYVQVARTIPRHNPYSPLQHLFDKVRKSNNKKQSRHEVAL